MNPHEVYMAVSTQLIDLLYGTVNIVSPAEVVVGSMDGPRPERYKTLRFDVDIDINERNLEKIRCQLFSELLFELLDLYVNGDTSSDDLLLRTQDGFLKDPTRGPVDIGPEARIYRQPKYLHGTMEYTIYLLVA